MPTTLLERQPSDLEAEMQLNKIKPLPVELPQVSGLRLNKQSGSWHDERWVRVQTIKFNLNGLELNYYATHGFLIWRHTQKLKVET